MSRVPVSAGPSAAVSRTGIGREVGGWCGVVGYVIWRNDPEFSFCPLDITCKDEGEVLLDMYYIYLCCSGWRVCIIIQ